MSSPTASGRKRGRFVRVCPATAVGEVVTLGAVMLNVADELSGLFSVKFMVAPLVGPLKPLMTTVSGFVG